MTENTDWASALAILAAGLVLGALFVYFFARRRAAAPPADLELKDLEARRDALVEQLRTEIAPDERARLERDAAQVLRAIDGKKARLQPAPAPQSAAAPVNPRKAAMIGFAWGVGSVLFLGGLWYFVTRTAKPREQDNAAAMQRAVPQDAMLAQLEESIRQNPDNLEARITLAQAYLERDNLMGVFEQTQYVLSKAPNHPRGLTYQALVRMAMGQGSEAQQMLLQATKTDPTLIDAWVALAWVHVQNGKTKEAEAAMQEAMRQRPDEKPRLEQVLAEMKQHRQTGAAPAQQGSQLPADHPPISPPPTAAAPAPAGGQAIRITLELDPAAQSKSGVIYVIARPEGVMAGPPVAVKRVSAAALPVTFDLSSADSMMGQPLPARVRIEARLDSDGDAATKDPSDPAGIQDAVALGSTLKISLK